MEGDDRRRFCAECRLHVYNLSAMTRPEATRFLQEQEGRVCVRLYRRIDGAVLTRDCPVGVSREQRQRLGKLAVATLLIASMVYWLVAALTSDGGVTRLMSWIRSVTRIERATMGAPRPQPIPREEPRWRAPGEDVMGGIAAPPDRRR
jgi:hypothetical protein